jgi:1-acyl-sn-glycerol-3-phosphate acyltransferase
MKQDVSTTPEQPAKVSKPAKNLYEPYVTPPIVYNLFRSLGLIIFSIIARIHVHGRYNIPRKGPFIVASNHLSWADVPLVPGYVPQKVVTMAKEELFLGKLGWLLRLLGAFPVKRGEADRQAIRTADEQLKKGNVLFIFPEGTRSRTHTLAKGHAGLGMIALRSGVPVIPVAIWGSERALKKFGSDVTISYGEPMVFKPKGTKITREDIDQTTEAIMHKIAEMLPPAYRGAYAEAEKL